MPPFPYHKLGQKFFNSSYIYEPESRMLHVDTISFRPFMGAQLLSPLYLYRESQRFKSKT